MDYQLPSYQEATGVQDWLDLVAAYVYIHDYRNLCLVNKRFLAVFAPLLYRSPLDMGGQLNVAGDPDRGELLYPMFFLHIPFQKLGLLADNSN